MLQITSNKAGIRFGKRDLVEYAIFLVWHRRIMADGERRLTQTLKDLQDRSNPLRWKTELGSG